MNYDLPCVDAIKIYIEVSNEKKKTLPSRDAVATKSAV